MRSFIIAMLVAAASVTGCAKDVRSVVIISAPQNSTELAMGDQVTSDTRVTLLENERVSFLDEAGNLHEISGPIQGRLGDLADLTALDAGGMESLAVFADILSHAKENGEDLGGTRSDEKSIWALSVDQIAGSVEHCIQSADEIILHRSVAGFDRGLQLPVEINNRQDTVQFGRNAAEVVLSSETTIDTLKISGHPIQLHIVEAGGTDELARLAFAQAGCAEQFLSTL